MPTSPEFISLCQSQVALLTQGLGSALSIVYLTEEPSSATDRHLIPIVSYPESALHWGEEQILSFLTQLRRNLGQPGLLPAQQGRPVGLDKTNLEETNEPDEVVAALELAYPTNGLSPQQQVMPLIYQEQVMGLLVTARVDRPWTEIEQSQIEQIVQSLTAACVLDRRARWLAADLQQQQLLEEQKTDLFDNLLHQFRNPLTALRTFGKLLTKRLPPGDTNYPVATSIVRESDRLQDLLQQLDTAIDSDVEDFSPILAPESNLPQSQSPSVAPALPSSETRMLLGSAIDVQPHALMEVLQSLLDSASAIAQDRQLTLSVDVPVDLPKVWIDERALREVLNNLLDNALKYTPANGRIQVSVHRQPGFNLPHRQAILIADTGPGIPPQDLIHLFERHYRGVQAQNDIPGTGLGLAIARDLVQQMQGDIQLFSPITTCPLLPAALSSPLPPSPGTAAVVWLLEVQA